MVPFQPIDRTSEALSGSERSADAASSNRRSFVRLGAAAAVAAAVTTLPGEAMAQAGTGVPDLFPGGNGRQFKAIQRHENEHVAFLRNALGASARPKPTFKNLLQPNVLAFATVTAALENTGVGAYLGAAPVILSRATLAAAGSIALVEARHAGWINSVLNRLTTINAFGQEKTFERAFTVAEVVGLANPFIQNLNGGPPLTFSSTPSASNDVAILNFALALEYLEADFYNINVPRFFA